MTKLVEELKSKVEKIVEVGFYIIYRSVLYLRNCNFKFINYFLLDQTINIIFIFQKKFFNVYVILNK